MRKYALPLVLLGAVTTAGAVPKQPAAGKAPPACGAKILPLVAGNTWTYNAVAAPAPLPEAMQRLAPAEPNAITVTVKTVEQKGADTVATLEEKHEFNLSKDPKEPKVYEHIVTGTITCNSKGKFEVDPQLYWFAGEPGGPHGLTFDKLERKKETSLKLTKGTIGDNEWIEEIAGHFVRTPAKGSENTKLASGSIEIERKFTPQPQERINTKLGIYTAEKLGLVTTGRVKFDKVAQPEGKPCTVTKPDPANKDKEIKVPSETCELPANWITTIWLAEGVGVVQTLNSYAHMYQLVDAQLK
jgi:hypothetical protein